MTQVAIKRLWIQALILTLSDLLINRIVQMFFCYCHQASYKTVLLLNPRTYVLVQRTEYNHFRDITIIINYIYLASIFVLKRLYQPESVSP